MSNYAGEEVLVVPRALFEETGAFQGIRTDGIEAAMDRLLDPANHFFMDRAAAEEDPSHKQLIAYCVLRHGDKILHYTRGKSGGESRLHAKLSVGVGGHINPIDSNDGEMGPAAYHAAVARELLEELNLSSGYRESIVALINDDSSPVGQVHLGVVHLIELDSDQIAAGEDALAELAFSTLEDLRGPLFERLETWSQFCVEYLAGE